MANSHCKNHFIKFENYICKIIKTIIKISIFSQNALLNLVEKDKF